MLQLRNDPTKNKVVAIATQRQDRTFHPPKDYCPLCPTKNVNIPTEIPEDNYDFVVFENKFPTFTENPDKIKNKYKSSFYNVKESKGICEVICYSADHEKYLEDQPVNKIKNLMRVWADRYFDLGNKGFIKYVFIFENKGKDIGVTLSHPHSQIYAFSYIPPILEEELKSSKNYYTKNKLCLHCSIIANEIKDKDRVVINNDDFIAFIPFYAKFPYEIHIYSKRHLGNITELYEGEITSLANIIKELILRYNKLFNFRMPYVMVIHQNPTDDKNYDFYHFHFEFYPPYREKNKLKYLAGCELGAGTFINDTLPEEKAEEMRSIKKLNFNRF
jgi:UDPglucose--hexose-1-phosphate uridylyltransferase